MSEREMWSLPGGVVLYNVHPASQCVGSPCWIHHPTNHHMIDWPMVQASSPRWPAPLMMRECLHGVLHLDPDQRWFVERILHVEWIEDCDGCCSVRTEGERDAQAT